MPRVGRPIMTYGLAEHADVRAVNVRREGLQTQFDVVRGGAAARSGAAAPLTVTLNLPGTHNVGNALAAIAVATELGIDDVAIARALAAFQGIDRRLQHIADVTIASGLVSIVDDYGHHPTEITATLEAVRQGYPGTAAWYWPSNRTVIPAPATSSMTSVACCRRPMYCW